MKKIILSLFVIVAIFFAIIASAIYMTDFDKAYTNFINNAKIEVKDSSKINYTVSYFPTPVLTISEIKEESKIQLKNIKLKFSLWSILKFNYQISDLTVEEAIIHLSHQDINFLSHDEFIAELINKEALDISAKIEKLVFVESDKDIPLIIENFDFSGGGKTTAFTGEIKSMGKLKGEFIKDANLIKFNLTIAGSGYNLSLQENYENTILKNGKMEIKTTTLGNQLIMLVPDLANLSAKLDSNEELKISLDIEPTGNLMNFKNIIIDSKSIQGTGSMVISKTPEDVSDIQINFTKIDLDSWSGTKTSDEKTYIEPIRAGNKFDFKKNQLRATIFAQDIKLDENNRLTEVNLKALINNGQLNIEDFSGIITPVVKTTTPENSASDVKTQPVPAVSNEAKTGDFRIKGVASQNSFRSLFTGTIALAHDNLNDLVEMLGGKELRTEGKIAYSMTSNVKCSSVDVSMQDLLIKTPNTEISGDISIKFIGNSPRTNARLKFSKINLNEKDFPALNYLYNYGLGLAEGSKDEGYINKFIPLRKITAISSYDIAFDELVLNDISYKNVSFNLGLSPGRIRLENLAANYDNNSIDMSIDLLASGIRTSFSIVVHSGTLETSLLSPSALLELRNKMLEKFALDKVDIYMSVVLNKLYHGNFELGRVVFRAKNNKSLLEISNFDADIFGGRMISSGSILLEPYTFNFVYALNSASISEIAKFLPTGMIQSGGAISASGMWSTNGNKLEELLYNLYTKSTVVTKDIQISEISLDDMVQAAGASNYNTKSFKDDMKQALLTGKTSISDLKAAMELSKGVFNLSQIDFKSKYTAGAASASFNLYDFNLDLTSVFSFYLAKPSGGRSYTDYTPVKLGIKASGNFLTPKKEADTKAFEEALEAAKKANDKPVVAGNNGG